MLGQQPPHHAGAALVLTVHALLRAHALVALRKGGGGAESSGLRGPGAPPPPRGPTHLEGLPAEVAAAELALEPPLGAVVLQMRRQVAAAQLGGAAVGAGHHVEAAGTQVALGGGAKLVSAWGAGVPLPRAEAHLQVPKGAMPAAALLAVDAADGQVQHLHLQLWVRVDLGSRGAVIRDSACDSPQFLPSPPAPHRLAGFLRARNILSPAKLPSEPRGQQVASAPTPDSGVPNSLTQGVAANQPAQPLASPTPSASFPMVERSWPSATGLASHPTGRGTLLVGTEKLCAPPQAGRCARPPGQTRASFANWPGRREQATFVGAHNTGLTLAPSPRLQRQLQPPPRAARACTWHGELTLA